MISKGQITIPKKIWEKLGVRPGEELGFEEKDDLIVVSKDVTGSPFDKWLRALEHLEGQYGDDLVGQARGHDNCR